MKLSNAGIQSVGEFISQSGQIGGIDTVTNSQSSFMTADAKGATASEYSFVQLWNPGTNTIFVDRIKGSTTANTTLHIGVGTTPRGTTNSNGRSMVAGGSLGDGDVRLGSDASLLEIGIDRVAVGAFVTYTWDLPYPIELPPSTGLLVTAGSVNLTLYAGFTWREV